MRLETLALLLVGLAPALAAQSTHTEIAREAPPPPGVVWQSGTLIQSQYKELAGTLVLNPTQPPVVRSEGHDYVLMPETLALEDPLFKNKAAVILKGIEVVLALPGRPVQFLYWPQEGTVRMKRFVFPDPAGDHWRWLMALGDREDP